MGKKDLRRLNLRLAMQTKEILHILKGKLTKKHTEKIDLNN